ncbi:uncharacterized protein LOC115581556 [Xyrichtys novacula]|uniref:Uncharacterized protein LOC115581556 n=1 Tax=Xyrichtys novacula TaxID=13765 RepID=A0AAV1G8H0_XYRNO|nr:uncharacterized protein LOC115581556 [Xyrichtys novacula]
MCDRIKGCDPDSRESYGLKISDFLNALAKRRPPSHTTHTDPRNISTTLSMMKNTGSFRSRAVLPKNINQLSTRSQFQRQDHLKETPPASVPVPTLNPAGTSNTLFMAHLVRESKMVPSSESVSSIQERLQKHEIHLFILGVRTWTKVKSCELHR